MPNAGSWGSNWKESLQEQVRDLENSRFYMQHINGVHSGPRGRSSPSTPGRTAWMATWRYCWNRVSKTVSQAPCWGRERWRVWAKDDVIQRTALTEALRTCKSWWHEITHLLWADDQEWTISSKILGRVMTPNRGYGFLAPFSGLQNIIGQNNLPNDAWKSTLMFVL